MTATQATVSQGHATSVAPIQTMTDGLLIEACIRLEAEGTVLNVKSQVQSFVWPAADMLQWHQWNLASKHVNDEA